MTQQKPKVLKFTKKTWIGLEMLSLHNLLLFFVLMSRCDNLSIIIYMKINKEENVDFFVYVCVRSTQEQ